MELFADSPLKGRIRNVYADVADVPAEARYARITSAAALEHICDLPLTLAREAARRLTPGRRAAHNHPEPGAASSGSWVWMCTTGLEFRLRHGLDYGLMMAHEHVNDALEIETLLRALFEDVRINSFGVGRQLSLYRFLAARRPRLDVAEAWERRLPR